MYQKSGKRIFDIVAAVIGLIILLPLFVLITVVLWFHFKGKPFFIQPRPGLNAAVFRLIKFRTMYLPGDSVSGIGQFLRKTSLDEIPQLWNVLRGDMSLVGPRPLLVEYLPLYTASQNLRHSVLPGITGLAQISGRNAINWDQKFRFDLYYIKNQSLALDLKILLLTIKKVILREGIELEDQKFNGPLSR
ncbi:sugar transferase [Dyadobacter sp. CY323]|uniref:sugar transferase n=1 Tax=Dyadobacter sp. CY323 TaxID=2907302 RepID=UPI001F25DBED|nr:sugar transferase [Dyadobacter sp. CY323]MCE6988835.1 sugar transferase [Dyadobacter sp. CY323]